MVHLQKENYSKEHCYQYEIRLKNLNSDIESSKLDKDEIQRLKVSDFKFRFVAKDEIETCQEIKRFIIRHEWLGKMPHRPTHRFIATYKDQLAGVIIMATPNSFSNLLGKKNRDLEKLISRGACISWSPKNLASALVMYSVNWMAKNTSFRFFTAYSDTQARELGTIYQACNFIYLGQNSGARYEYNDPNNPDRGWFSDRLFRKTSSYKQYAKDLGIIWQKDWSKRDKIFWEKMPQEISQQLKESAKTHQRSCVGRSIPPKHKYIYIRGRSKNETKQLRTLFSELNPKKIDLPYPKNRVPVYCGRPKLTKRPTSWWPSNQEQLAPTKKLYSIKEVSKMYGLTLHLIYQQIKTDPTFPHINVGIRKRYLIDIKKLDLWLEAKSKTQRSTQQYMPTIDELLEVRV